MATATCLMKRAHTAKRTPHTVQKSSSGKLPDDEEKRYVGNTHKGNIRHERETEDKNTGLVTRITVAIRLSLRVRPNSRNVPYRAKAPSQASTTVETRRAENENP